jgi:hypothetical protein
MPDNVLSEKVNKYDRLPEVDYPKDVSIAIADGMFVKHYVIPKVGTYLPQHSHEYDHATLVCHGSVRVWVDGRYLGLFKAPKAIEIKAHTRHLFEVMEPDTTLACIHRIDRTGEIDVAAEHQIV